MNKYLFSILLIISFMGCNSDYGTFRGVTNEVQPLRDKLSSSNTKIQQESINNNSVELEKVYKSMNSYIYSIDQFLEIMKQADKDIKDGRDTYNNLHKIISGYLKKMKSDQKVYFEYLELRKGLSIEITGQMNILTQLDKVYAEYSNEYAN